MIYAINKRTKEHRVIGKRPPLGHYPDEGWVWVEADADGRIPWECGEECPLPDYSPCEVKLRNGEVVSGHHAIYWCWGLSGAYDDIIAYRPILGTDTKPEAPEWAIGDRCTWHLGDVCMGEHVILAKDGDTYWIRDDHGGYDMADREELRPIRTPAQRAEDEAVEEMAPTIRAAANDVYTTVNGSAADSIARAIYRAGYRKT
jgi:hypothetical protein